MLSVDDLHGALTDLGARAFAQGKTVELAIYGGSALMLAATDQGLIDQLAQDRCWR